ncbi:MFS family permease [Pullulanibacillus pueri]|uniref:Putative MFS-type transporter YfkF n=1 Tax=Pullulanibacillus pueri TaxID=1437324 RepID=A0A8J2ZUV6_9BACL|nr:MFS transporter [Pullulanibacillus pueri]MBM7680724.1 MFS family permease [Pullulanibacillus pueri]GGH78088.1 putative MFS-type transporter YfkF [Pullulanibacillus pueri]
MTHTSHSNYRLIVLVGAVLVSGAAQGMLLPLLSLLLEDHQTSAALNGLNASGLYIGVLLASPFIEKPMQKYGYKPILMVGLGITAIALMFFPIWENFWFWFALRLFIGIGDNMMHFSAQVWIMVTSPKEKKGRNVAIYGLAFGVGFAIGPSLSRLLSLGIYWPFMMVSLGCLLFFLAALLLTNDYPDHGKDQPEKADQRFTQLSRYKKVIRLGWSGLSATFAYGFLEASLNGNFPVFGIRNGFTVDQIAYLLPIFVIGSLITQVPMGSLGDRIGRRSLILCVTLFGAVGFIAAIFLSNSFISLAVVFLLSGMFVGSLYSTGMTYISDLLPNSLLPIGNILAGVSFSFGSMLGPFIGGLFIRWLPDACFFAGIASAMLIAFFCTLGKKRSSSQPLASSFNDKLEL